MQEAAAQIHKLIVGILQGHTAKDFLRRLKAQYVNSSQAQEDGADDPTAFNWHGLGEDVALMFRSVPGAFCMVGAASATRKLQRDTHMRIL